MAVFKSTHGTCHGTGYLLPIVLAHGLTLVREGLAALCQAQPQFRVVAQCSDGGAALRLIESP